MDPILKKIKESKGAITEIDVTFKTLNKASDYFVSVDIGELKGYALSLDKKTVKIQKVLG